jgi:hypothetical protein
MGLRAAEQSVAVAPVPAVDPIKSMVGQLELERYKATIKSLTQFGDRKQGTARNRAALDWIEAQLKSYGYSNTTRMTYEFMPTDPRRPSGPAIANSHDLRTSPPSPSSTHPSVRSWCGRPAGSC